MPKIHKLTQDWTGPLAVQSGDVVQNQSGWLGVVELATAAPAADTATLHLDIGAAVVIDRATQIWLRSVSSTGAASILRGL
ncbi:MAG: hypothetical protein Q4G24_10585 [Paracoccus sp. (in: a-proteobacteria)]|uniref:hypothetical protein n=1 Tax=Paracoccus sp. TaxID=267 RepID=UPI0026E05808|nr:hypothetical protein [Paracoccus sp. (in: a-proteobacteria)]MDO5621904.1 hypothetical protein [Paracoccus sp. (in: a-proteobacteria)]